MKGTVLRRSPSSLRAVRQSTSGRRAFRPWPASRTTSERRARGTGTTLRARAGALELHFAAARSPHLALRLRLLRSEQAPELVLIGRPRSDDPGLVGSDDGPRAISRDQT